ncbi:MAG: hypothetical protein HKN56_07690 [Gammaproteobacteria bacterium]|nr:hypothetical protein [Gammaproteobacteria bacterium]
MSLFATRLTERLPLLRGLLLTCALTLLLGGCSSRFFYDRIDAFIVWKLGDYVTLTDAQKLTLKNDIQAHLDGVRENELTRIAALISEFAGDFESLPVPASRFELRYQQSMELYDEIMLGLVPLTERFLRGLSEAQIEEFFTRLDEANEEMYDEYLGRTPEDREKARNKSAVKGIQDFTGRLRKDQKLLVTDTLARMEDASDEWIAYQQEWRDQFRALVTRAPEGEAYTEKLTELMVYPRQLHTPEYRERVDRNRVMLTDMLSELSAGLSDRQQRRTMKELNGYVELLHNLAKSE